MRRILTVLAAMAIMAAMVAVTAVPAFATTEIPLKACTKGQAEKSPKINLVQGPMGPESNDQSCIVFAPPAKGPIGPIG